MPVLEKTFNFLMIKCRYFAVKVTKGKKTLAFFARVPEVLVPYIEKTKLRRNGYTVTAHAIKFNPAKMPGATFQDFSNALAKYVGDESITYLPSVLRWAGGIGMGYLFGKSKPKEPPKGPEGGDISVVVCVVLRPEFPPEIQELMEDLRDQLAAINSLPAEVFEAREAIQRLKEAQSSAEKELVVLNDKVTELEGKTEVLEKNLADKNGVGLVSLLGVLGIVGLELAWHHFG